MKHKSRFRTFWNKAASTVGITAMLFINMGNLQPVAHAQSQVESSSSFDELGCHSATPLLAAGAGTRTLDRSIKNSQDWIKFTIKENARYKLHVDGANLRSLVRDNCSLASVTKLVPDGEMEFTATKDGVLYLNVVREELNTASATDYTVSLSPAAPHRLSKIQLATIPEAVQRRASDFLEELRGSELAPEWKDARLSTEVRIIYRPDMQEPAYYEFPVEKPTDTGFEPAGFIQLSAGEHDYPVAHWDVTGLSPTQEIEDVAPLGEVTLTEFYKVDALSYAAEYENITPLGITTVTTDVFNIGDLPGRIDGLSSLPAEPAELQGDSVGADGTITHEGPEELPLSDQQDWDSWGALKAGYKEEYSGMLASLEERASDFWTLENGIQKYGESLIKDDIRTVKGLPSQTLNAIDVSGAGAVAEYLQQERVVVSGTLTGIKLTVLAEPTDIKAQLPFSVTLQYSGGVSETVKYAIVNSVAVAENAIYLPLISSGGNNQVTAAESSQATGDWGPWSYWWANGNAGALRYGQFDVSGCASGCGATAWAILFGWVDQRASIDAAPFANHDGIYRQNGGTGTNVIAPNSQDEGVRNMTREIRGQIGTFCIFGSGATWPWNMIDAANYVRPRATAGWRMNTKYDPTGLCWFGACNGARDLAKDAIQNRRQPAVVGTGWLKHYPVAYGYAERSRRSCFLFFCSTDYSRWFYVNNGHYGTDNGWTSADVWFGGTYYNN